MSPRIDAGNKFTSKLMATLYWQDSETKCINCVFSHNLDYLTCPPCYYCWHSNYGCFLTRPRRNTTYLTTKGVLGSVVAKHHQVSARCCACPDAEAFVAHRKPSRQSSTGPLDGFEMARHRAYSGTTKTVASTRG